MTQAQWMVHTKKADFEAIGREFNISPVTARIIRNRDITEKDDIKRFLYGSAADMYDPFMMKDMEKAVMMLDEAIAEGKHIRIVGDYDMDGVCATVILYKAFKSMGAEVSYDIPDRETEGYGINKRIIDDAGADGVDLIITCDNGIAAFEEAEYAKLMGLDMIITDHHEVPFTEKDGIRKYHLPPADAVVDTKQKGCDYPFREPCGAGIAFKLACAMDTDPDTLNELAKFAAIATIGDVVPLKDENRIIVKAGLELINECETKSDTDSRGFNKGLYALLETTGLIGKSINSYHIGFVVGPCVNAAGRLANAKMAVELFLENDMQKAMNTAKELCELNSSRKGMTEKMTRMAKDEVAKSKDDVIVVYLPECHEAVAGIVAGRLKEFFYRPVFVLTDAGDGSVKGSGRSIDGYVMNEEITACADLLTKFGGHAKAAGLSMPKENIDEFRKRLNENASFTQDQLKEKIWIDVPMYADYPDMELIKEFEILAPFGEANPKPVFADKELIIEDLRVLGANKNVLRLKLKTPRGKTVEAIRFLRDETEVPSIGQKVSILYYPEINEFNGIKSIQLLVEDMI